MRKPKVVKPKTIKPKVHTKAELIAHMQKLRDELQSAVNLIGALQNEIKEVVI